MKDEHTTRDKRDLCSLVGKLEYIDVVVVSKDDHSLDIDVHVDVCRAVPPTVPAAMFVPIAAVNLIQLLVVEFLEFDLAFHWKILLFLMDLLLACYISERKRRGAVSYLTRTGSEDTLRESCPGLHRTFFSSHVTEVFNV